MRLQEANKFLYRKIISPRSVNKDQARREFILNILLVWLALLSTIGFLINIIHPLLYPSSEGQSPLLTGVITFFLYTLLFISRKGKSMVTSAIFIWFLSLVGVYMCYYWGADLPATLLFFALLIVMTGILINSMYSFIIATLCGVTVIIFSYLTISGVFRPHLDWKGEIVHMVDAVIYAIILGIIAIVSWLSNREIEKALRRARASEAIVRKQRDSLEIQVEKRTKELRQAEAEKLSQLYRFAEFGRMATGLFHDLATPLNLITLNLDMLQKENKKINKQKITDSKVLLTRAIQGTHRLENFIQAARKQLQTSEVRKKFSLSSEISQAMKILEYKARKNGVKMRPTIQNHFQYVGNPSKFNQLVTNLISNAIDSYEGSKRGEKIVEIRLVNDGKNALFEVKDWGRGISEKNKEHIFEPFFTTKSKYRGMGMGLSICRDVVTKDLKGHLKVSSQKGKGTIFTVDFPLTQKS